jgi:hypothetical protein
MLSESNVAICTTAFSFSDSTRHFIESKKYRNFVNAISKIRNLECHFKIKINEQNLKIKPFVLLDPADEGRHYSPAKRRGHFQKGLIKTQSRLIMCFW